jgi:hypothetical protein
MSKKKKKKVRERERGSSSSANIRIIPSPPIQQLLFLMAAYGYVLMSSSNLISEGSELLLLIPSLAGLVGS